MNRWIKALTISVALVIAVCAALVVTAFMLFDAEKIKFALVDTVEQKTGRRLTIEGLPELAIWPRLGMRLGAVSLTEKSSDELFAGVERASVSIAVLPLLSGELQADALEVSGLRARVVRYADGSFNFSDLVAAAGQQDGAPPRSGAPGSSAGKSSPAPPMRFVIAGVRIAGQELRWKDEASGQQLALTDFLLDSGRLGLGASGELGFRGVVSLAGSTGPARSDRLQLSLRSHYQLDSGAVVLSGVRGEVEGAAAGVAGLKLVAGGERVSLQPASGAVDAAGLSLAAGGRLDDRKFQLDLRLPQLRWQQDAVDGGTQRLSLPGAELAASVAQAGRRFEATLKSGVVLTLPALDLTLARIGGELRASDPQLFRQPVRLALAGDAAANLARASGTFQGSLALDDTQARLDLALDSAAPLTARAAIAIDALDIDRYLLPPVPAPAGAAPPPAADVPVDLSPLAGPTLKAKLTVGRLKLRDLVAEQLRIEASLAAGRLVVAPLSARLYEGQLDGRVQADAAEQTIAVRAKLVGVALGPLLQALAKIDLLSGRAQVDADLRSGGRSVAALKSALAGDIALRVSDGALKGVNLAQRFRELKGRTSAQGDAGGEARTGEATDFSELTATFKVRDGVVRGDDLSAKSPFLRLAGAGSVDLPNETLDYLLKASVVTTAAGQGGEGLEHLRGVTVPVRLSGPLVQPRWRIELGALVGEAAKARVAEKKEEVKAEVREAVEEKREAVRERAKEKLKGLLGR
jgi:AsmA protein